MFATSEKVKGNVWARLMIGQMGEYINGDQFRLGLSENNLQNIILTTPWPQISENVIIIFGTAGALLIDSHNSITYPVHSTHPLQHFARKPIKPKSSSAHT